MDTLPIADRATVRRAGWSLLAADRGALTVVILLTSLAALAGLAGPWLLGRIIDHVHEGTSAIDLTALAVVGFAVAQLVFLRFARYTAYRLGERALARLREGFVADTLALPIRVVEKAGTGDLMIRSAADVTTVGATLRDAAPDVAICVVQIVFILGATFLLHPVLGLCALAGMPLLWFVARWYLARARDAYLAEGAATSDIAESLAATAAGARTVEAFGLSARRVADADTAVDTGYHARVRTLFLRSVLFPVMEAAQALPTATVLLVGGMAYVDGMVSLGAAVTGSLYMWQLVAPVNLVLQWMEQLQSSGAAFARIKGVGLVPVDVESTTRTPMDDRIEVRGVSYAYVDGHDVLHDVDLVIRPGERLAIVGPSGAGKSTLGRLLSGADVPRTGHIQVGGVPVAELPADELGKRIALVTQEHHVFLGTPRDNLALAAPETDDTTMRAALVAVDAHWAIEALDAPLGPGGLIMDAAKAQQLALARVVLADPHTVVLDEATSLLDPTTARHTERSLAAVLRGRTVIAIAHRLHTAHDADRVAVVEAGRITELGSHSDLIAADGPYAALWRSWHGAA
ncbi:MAG: ABC transporter ATP-binding protein/permease [Actinomycetota bacterium]|nr:ABC transporter ATP-binding protein/permease [Actinomycetota bacterium]